MNTGTLIQEVRARIPEATANIWTDLNITNWLNDAQNQMVQDLTDAALVGNSSTSGLVRQSTATMSANAGSVAIPASTERILSVYVQYAGRNEVAQARQVPVGAVNWNEQAQQDAFAHNVTIFSPCWWAERAGIQIRPGATLTSAAVSVVNVISPVALVSSVTTDIPIFPASYHHLLVEYAVHVAKRYEREYAESQQVFGIYRDGIAQINARYAGIQGAEPRRTSVAPSEV